MRPCFKKIISIWIVAALATGWPSVSTVHALSIKEEAELADAFLNAVHQAYDVIDDPMINNYINQVGRKIVSAVFLKPLIMNMSLRPFLPMKSPMCPAGISRT